MDKGLLNVVKRLFKSEKGQAFLDAIKELSCESHYLEGHHRYSDIYKDIAKQGLLNTSYFSYYNYRILPYWAYQQFQPSSPYYCQPGTPIAYINSTFRNWTTLSFPHSDITLSVDPRGLISPSNHRLSVDVWLLDNKKLVSPSKLEDIHQVYDPTTGVIDTSYMVDSLKVSQQVFMKTYKQNEPLGFISVTLSNTSIKKHHTSLYFALRPYNSEGILDLRSISYLTDRVFVANDKLSLIFDQVPDNILCLNHDDGDVSEHYDDWQMILKCTCPNGLASAFAEYQVSLKPGESTTFTAKIPLGNTSPIKQWFQNSLPALKLPLLKERISKIKEFQADNEKAECINDWTPFLEGKTHITTGDARINCQWERSKRYLLSSLGYDGVFSGGQTYKRHWLKDSIRIMRALLRIGAVKDVIRHLNTLPYMSPNNRPVDVLEELDSAGMLMMFLEDVYQFSRDRQVVETYYPLAFELLKLTLKRQHKGSPKSNTPKGFIGPSLSSDVDPNKDYYLADQYWTLAGLRSSTHLAKLIHHQEGAEYSDFMASQLGRSIDQFLATQETQHGHLHLPISQKRVADPALTMSLSTVYPMNLFSPSDKRISHTLKLIEHYFSYNGLPFSGRGHAGYRTVDLCSLAQVYLARRDDKAFTILNWLSDRMGETGTLPESIHPKSLHGSAGDGHYFVANAEYMVLVRNILVSDYDQVLHLFPQMPASWLFPKNDVFQLRSLPTQFGTISLTLEKTNNDINIDIDAHYHTQPLSIQLHLPVDFSSVHVDEQQQKTVSANSVSIPATAKHIQCKLQYEVVSST